MSELTKAFVHRGLDAPLYHWRDATGHEIDVIIDLERPTVSGGGEVVGDPRFPPLRQAQMVDQYRFQSDHSNASIAGCDISARSSGAAQAALVMGVWMATARGFKKRDVVVPLLTGLACIAMLGVGGGVGFPAGDWVRVHAPAASSQDWSPP